MVDITRNGLYNQKRSVSVGVFDLTEAEILAVAGVANLPERCVVTDVKAIVKTVSTTGSSSISVLVGAVDIGNDIAVTVAGVIPEVTVAPKYFPTGGAITVVGGATPPAAGDLLVEVVVEYIELDKVTGEYTN